MTKLIEKPTYELSSGTKLELAPVPPFLLHAVMTSTAKAPQVPFIEVTRAKKTAYEPNYADENYQRAVEMYESEQQNKILFLLFTRGIVGSVEDYVKDKNYMADLKQLTEYVYGPDYTKEHMKYIWITNELKSVEEITDLQSAIEEIVTPSQKAIEDSKSDL